jgi:hypothetical protein
MNRTLRKRHRRVFAVLGVALPIAFVVGIAARQPVPVMDGAPLGIAGTASDLGQVVWSKEDLWPGNRLITILRRNAAGSVALELRASDLTKPDLLVYWAEGKGGTTDKLPDKARLLGAWVNRAPLRIPGDLRGAAGRLVLYSLADQEVVAVSSAFIIQAD